MRKYRFIVTAEWAQRARSSGGRNYVCRAYYLDPVDPHGVLFLGQTDCCSAAHCGVDHEGWQIVLEHFKFPPRIRKAMADAQAADEHLPNLQCYFRHHIMHPLGVYLQEIR